MRGAWLCVQPCAQRTKENTSKKGGQIAKNYTPTTDSDWARSHNTRAKLIASSFSPCVQVNNFDLLSTWLADCCGSREQRDNFARAGRDPLILKVAAAMFAFAICGAMADTVYAAVCVASAWNGLSSTVSFELKPLERSAKNVALANSLSG